TARQIREELFSTRAMTHGSVFTLLKRLEAKQLVTREKGKLGKAFVYRPRRAPGPTHRSLVRHLLDRVFAGSPAALVAALLDSRKPTAAEPQQIQQMLQDFSTASQAQDKP